MSALDKLIKERASAKGKVTFQVNILKTLLSKEGPDAQKEANKADDAFKKLESNLVKFKAAHLKYCEAAEDNEAGDTIEKLIETNETYLKEVEDAVYEVTHLNKVFTGRLKFPGVKEALQTEAGAYKLQRKMIRENSNKVDKAEPASAIHVPLADIRTTFNKAFVSLVKAQSEFKRVCEDLGLDHQAELKNVDEEILFGIELNEDFQTLRTDASSMINKQEELKVRQAAAPPTNRATATPTPIKLAKADAISFSGEPRDFPRFKIEFLDIVVPNRDDQEIGLRLKQAVPKKHSHLLDNFSLRDHVAMMERLEEYFGTSEKIVCSVTADIRKLKIPSDDKSFVEFVGRIEKAERELRAMGLIAELANESSLLDITQKFPNLIAHDWSRVMEEKKLLGKGSNVKFGAMMEFLSLKRKSAEYEVSKAELSPNKSGSRYCVVTGLTLTASATATTENNETKTNKYVDCFICSERGEKADHSMRRCSVWVNLPADERKRFVKCSKHPFSNDHSDEDCVNSLVKCYNCDEVGKHHVLMCDKLEISPNYVTSKAAKSTSSDVLLKTMVVNVGKSGKTAGLMEDNASTDNYVAKAAVIEHELEKEADVVLQIEGINSTKTIDSAMYRVPLMDSKGQVHNIKCYVLDEITEETIPINPDKYKKMCSQLRIRPGQVKRPVKIDILLSSRNNFLMSERVRAESGGLKLYQGPLGLTISGASGHSQGKSSSSHLAKVNPTISSVMKAKVIKSFTKTPKTKSLFPNDVKSDIKTSGKIKWKAFFHFFLVNLIWSLISRSNEAGLIQDNLSSSLGKADLAKTSVDARELHRGPGEDVQVAAGELHRGPGGDVPNQVINQVKSLKKIINIATILSRLGGRVGAKFRNENFHKLVTKVPHFLSPISQLLGRCSGKTVFQINFERNFDSDPDSDRTRFPLVQRITNQFGRTWTNVYFPTLLRRQKWYHAERNLIVGDVCVMKDSNVVRGEWRKCRVSAVFPDNKARVRNIKVILLSSQAKGSTSYNTVKGKVDSHASNVIVIVPNVEDKGQGEAHKDQAELEKPGE